jgi:hypothetical protein
MTLDQINQINDKLDSPRIKKSTHGFCGFIKIQDLFPIHFYEKGKPLTKKETDESIMIFNLNVVTSHLDWFVELIKKPNFMGFWVNGYETINSTGHLVVHKYPDFVC